jgi:hypothetical protein
VSSTLIDGLGYYGIDLTESKIMPMGASTLQCIELQKDNRTFSARKSYTCNMDTMVSTVCMRCNINKFKCYKYVTLSLFNLYIESTNKSFPSKITYINPKCVFELECVRITNTPPFAMIACYPSHVRGTQYVKWMSKVGFVCIMIQKGKFQAPSNILNTMIILQRSAFKGLKLATTFDSKIMPKLELDHKKG